MTEPEAPRAADPAPAAAGSAGGSRRRNRRPRTVTPAQPRATTRCCRGCAGLASWSWPAPSASSGGRSSSPNLSLRPTSRAWQDRVARLEQRPRRQPGAPVDLGPLNARVAALEQRATPDLAPLEARVAALEKQVTDNSPFAAQAGRVVRPRGCAVRARPGCR